MSAIYYWYRDIALQNCNFDCKTENYCLNVMIIWAVNISIPIIKYE